MRHRTQELFSFFSRYQQKAEEAIYANFSVFGKADVLRDACVYALSNGGKRFRPALVFIIAHALGHSVDVSQAALAIEYFHTASLVADDLPCMDDAEERRKKPSVHKAYGETVALLSSYALIAAGYDAIAKNSRQIAESSLPFAAQGEKIGLLALENASYNTGISGATGGQFLDIFPLSLTEETARETIYKKTVSLFEISFVFGWLFGGGAIEALEEVKKAAYHFGMAFQIADDIEDVTQDASKERKINLAAILGEKGAKEAFYREKNSFVEKLKEIRLESKELLGAIDCLVV